MTPKYIFKKFTSYFFLLLTDDILQQLGYSDTVTQKLQDEKVSSYVSCPPNLKSKCFCMV